MRSHYAFTLIELMLALAISSILIGIAYPAYIAHEVHAQRNRAEIALMQLASKMEVYFTDNETYANATIDGLHAENLVDGLEYQLAISSATDSHYEIQAVPIGAQADRDMACEILSLTDTNMRSISGNGDLKQCWL
jgi:type IV pilus assembly protein PilE